MTPQQIKDAKKLIRAQGKLNAMEREILKLTNQLLARPSVLLSACVSALQRKYVSQYRKIVDMTDKNES